MFVAPTPKARDFVNVIASLMLWSMAMDDEAVYVVLGIENQDKIHYAMAVKNMLYDALQYAKQVEGGKAFVS